MAGPYHHGRQRFPTTRVFPCAELELGDETDLFRNLEDQSVVALVADAGALLGAPAREPDGCASWPAFENTMRASSAVIVPDLILGEVDSSRSSHRPATRRRVAERLAPRTAYPIEPLVPADLLRAIEASAKIPELRLGLVDGPVAAVAGRLREYRTLTAGRSDRGRLRAGRRFERVLVPVP